MTCPKDGEDETLMKHDQTDGLNHHLVVKTKTHYKWFVGFVFIFPYIGNTHPNWLIFFRGVETTNHILYFMGKLSPEWIDVRLMLVGLPADLDLMFAA